MKEVIMKVPSFSADYPKAPIYVADLVRCKECRWRKQDKSCDLNCRIDYIDGTEADMWFYTEDDDFCSYGERRE